METNLLALITQSLTPSAVPALAKNLGESETSVAKGIGALIPVVLGGLAAKAGTPAGATAVFSSVTGPGVATGLSSNFGSLIGLGHSSELIGKGKSLLSGLFGADKASGLGSALAGVSGLKQGNAANVAMMAVPLVFSQLKSFITEHNLNAKGFASLLGSQKQHLAGKLDPTLTSALGLGTPASILAGGAPQVATATTAAASSRAAGGLSRWLPWLLGLLVLIGLLWYVLGRTAERTSNVATTSTAATSVQFPAKVYFATGKADIGTEGAAVIKSAAAALAGNSTTVDVTGYTDKTGDSAANEELAKNRALAVKVALEAAGVSANRIQSKPPVFVEQGVGAADAEARRVDISSR